MGSELLHERFTEREVDLMKMILKYMINKLIAIQKKCLLNQPIRFFQIVATIFLFVNITSHSIAQKHKVAGNKLFENRFPTNTAPVIGAWFPDFEQFKNPEGYKSYLDAFSNHSNYSLLTTTMRTPLRSGEKQIVDMEVHDWFKKAVNYAASKQLRIALELDPRHSTPAFEKKYPNELQQRLWLREFKFNGKNEINEKIIYDLEHGDAITTASVKSIELKRVYAYKRNANGIQNLSIKDITNLCNVTERGRNFIKISVQKGDLDNDFEVCVINNVTLNYPDVFSPHLMSFELKTMKQYSDMPLAGLLKDEFGFPACHDGNPNKNGFWYSSFLAAAYAKGTTGRDIVRDALLMWAGEEGRESERQVAVNQIMAIYRNRCTEIEQSFYRNTKMIFGKDAFVGTHTTVFPMPNAQEFERNGFDWYTATRDYAQADETTPYAFVISMSKKFQESVWYNQYYAPQIKEYEKNIWKYATIGGRMNFHQLYPTTSKSWLEDVKGLLKGDLKRGDARIRLLNFISKAPVDCPVAIIFGNTNAMNWVGKKFEDVGVGLADICWRKGYYADLIPSSEIQEKSLRIDDEGFVWFGKQKYTAVVLYQPEFDNKSTADFFKKAANSGRPGPVLIDLPKDVTSGRYDGDFNGKSFDAKLFLPKRMKTFSENKACSETLINDLNKDFASLIQTPVTDTMPSKDMLGRSFTPTFAPSEEGITRLTDGTVIVLSGQNNVAGDTIIKKIKVKGLDVSFDIIGVGGIRLAKDGSIEAMVGGGLKSFVCGDFSIQLSERIDVVLIKENGIWQGYVQGLKDEIPNELKKITNRWKRIPLPEILN